MKKGITLCMAVLQCLLLLSFAMCAFAQNQPKENSLPIPKPEDIGQFFALRDGVLTPLQEEKNISSHDSFPAGHKILTIKRASSSTVLTVLENLHLLYICQINPYAISRYDC